MKPINKNINEFILYFTQSIYLFILCKIKHHFFHNYSKIHILLPYFNLFIDKFILKLSPNLKIIPNFILH